MCRIKPPESQLKVTLKWGPQKRSVRLSGYIHHTRVLNALFHYLLSDKKNVRVCGSRSFVLFLSGLPFWTCVVVDFQLPSLSRQRSWGQSYDFQTFLISIIKTLLALLYFLHSYYYLNIKTHSIFLGPMHFLLSVWDVWDVLWRYAVSNWHFAY